MNEQMREMKMERSAPGASFAAGHWKGDDDIAERAARGALAVVELARRKREDVGRSVDRPPPPVETAYGGTVAQQDAQFVDCAEA